MESNDLETRTDPVEIQDQSPDIELANVSNVEGVEHVDQERSLDSNLFKEGPKDNEVRRRKGFHSRKKNDRSKSSSPNGYERPKKRVRDDNDPYDIDRFIFTLGGNKGHQNMEDNGTTGVFLTPDLNDVEGREVQKNGAEASEERNVSLEQQGAVGEDGIVCY
ncbi:hypothetical protein Hanom_Chr14g01323901 [Helianthus anomalus]